jgi:uncharacterized short protein YbdD (DUF466 family)
MPQVLKRMLVLLSTGARHLAWFLNGMLGGDAYEKYTAHHRAVHAGHAGDGTEPREKLMTEREFWRDRTDREERNPQGRCC